MPQFRYDPNRGSFRNWLRRVASNRAKNFLRSRYGKATAVGGSESERRLAELSEGDSLAARQWDREHDQFVLGKLLDKVRAKFDAKTWEAFWRTAKLGEKPAAVAALLQISENAVYLAKSRVLQRLRKEAEEATGLLD
jgi:RNA polymerase sigma-70 factor (ECF subfamily)